jgi:hypothetical protein
MGLTIIIVGVIAVVIAIYLGNAIYNEIQDQHDTEHSQYCHAWSDRLDQTKNQTDSMGDAQIAQFNSEINQYNHECVKGA